MRSEGVPQNPPKRLVWAIRVMAQPYAIQSGLYPWFVWIPDDLAAEIDLALMEAEIIGYRTPRPLEVILNKTETIGGKPEFWDNTALENEPIWEELRQLARNLLDHWGVDHKPPQEPKGTIYIGPEQGDP